MRRPTIVTTSWDDGDPNDTRIAEMLHSRGLPGTFYTPIKGYKGGETMPDSDLRALCSAGFEIGAHTVSHKCLPSLKPDELDHEVRTCKYMLEQTLGREVVMFCYPNGRYDADVIQHVKDAGYHGARTTRMLWQGHGFLPFEMPTTVQAYPHPRSRYLRNLGRARVLPDAVNYITQLRHFGNWVEIGKGLFDQATKYGGTWHLYGHSWEIDQLDIWDDLGEVLDYVSHRETVKYINNGELLSFVENSPASVMSAHERTAEPIEQGGR